MTFQIISKEDKQAITLNEFDTLYCNFAGVEVSNTQYAAWFCWLEGVFNIFGDLADNAFDSYFAKGRLGIKKHSRQVTLHQAAQLMLVNLSSLLFKDDRLTDDYFKSIQTIVNFYQEFDNKFYFEFHF